MRWLAIGTVLLGAGCVAPASELYADCEPQCLTESSLRRGSVDLLVTSPRIWQFFDDYTLTLPGACVGADAGSAVSELVPLWHHTINPVVPTSSYPRSGKIGGRGSIAAHANGTVAVSVGGTVWLFDGRTGTPRHALTAASTPELEHNGRRLSFTPSGVAAFTPDGESLWVSADSHPALLDLSLWDRALGPHVAFAWGSGHGADPWHDRSQAVGTDGTLYWRGTSGVLRALEPGGTIRWEAPVMGGTPRVDPNGFVSWSDGAPPRGLSPADGREVWRPQQLSSWRSVELTNSENAAPTALIPMKYQTNSAGGVSLQRLDGTIARVFEFATDGGLGAVPDSTAQSELGTLFSAVHRFDSSNSVVGVIEALDESTGALKWTTKVSSLATDPRAGKNEALYLVTDDCRVSVLDRSGRVAKSHQMIGRPTGDLMQVQNGILFVLTEIQTGLRADQQVFPGQVTVPRDDGGVSRLEDYECVDNSSFLCGQPIRGQNPFLFILYAFAVE